MNPNADPLPLHKYTECDMKLSESELALGTIPMR